MGISSLSVLYAHTWYAQKKKKKKKSKEYKSKKNKNAFKYGCKYVSKRCGSYRMYLEGDSPHKAIMIVRELNWFSHISNCYNMRHLWLLLCFHTQQKNSLLLLIHVQVQCDLAITRDTCVIICSLNLVRLVFEI